VPVLVLAVGSFIAGVIVANSSCPNYQAVAAQFAHAWAQHDFARMYSLLDRQSRQRLTEAQFASQYQSAATTATLRSLVVQRVGAPNGRFVPVTIVARTAVFGTIHAPLLVPYDSRNGVARVRFQSTLLFPGLRPGEQLSRSVSLPPRAT